MEIRTVKDDIPLSPIYEEVDARPSPKSAGAASHAVADALAQAKAALEAARKPGMPLSILANVAREAPLGSLLAAFLLGIAVGRRRH